MASDYLLQMSDLVSPVFVSDFLLTESRERGELLTNLKLQKLLFYSQAWHLALYDTQMFDEEFQAWVHGPVLPTQYRRFSDFRWMPITTDVKRPQISTPALEEHLKEIINVFGTETAVSLELMTHREKPWIDARQGLAPDTPSERVIPKTAIRDFYRAMADD